MNTTKLLAKVETRQALLNFQGILAEADGIIISRGEAGRVRQGRRRLAMRPVQSSPVLCGCYASPRTP